MIVTPNDPAWSYALSLAADPVDHVEVTYGDLTVYFADNPSEPFPISSLKKGAFREALNYAWEEYPVVCVMHKRFVPCRSYGDHAFSIEPDDVDVVRRYQSE